MTERNEKTGICADKLHYYRDEMIRLFISRFDDDGFSFEKEDDMLLAKHLLSGTWFLLRLDMTMCMHWHILNTNCIRNCDKGNEFSSEQCAEYIKNNRFGRAIGYYRCISA